MSFKGRSFNQCQITVYSKIYALRFLCRSKEATWISQFVIFNS